MRAEQTSEPGFDPSKRWFLKTVAGAGLGAAVSLALPSIASAQEQIVRTIDGKISRISIVEPTNFTPVTDAELPVIFAEPGTTTEEELKNLPDKYKPLRVTDLGGGLVAYDYLSSLKDRPSRIIVQKGGNVLFKRRVIPRNTMASSRLFRFGNFRIEGLVDSPAYYEETFSRQDRPETIVDNKAGITIIGNSSTGELYEIQTFIPTATLKEYSDKWGEKYYNQPTPPLNSRPFLVVVPGINTSIEKVSYMPVAPFEDIENDLSPYFNIATFSYSGGYLDKRPGQVINWIASPYTPKQTHQSPLESARLLMEMVEQLDGPAIIMGHSLGGLITFIYLSEYVYPEYGRHHSGYIDKALLLDAPIHGIPGTRIPAEWFQGDDFDTAFGNTAATYIAEMASSPEKQRQTIAANTAIARSLRNNHIVDLGGWTNQEDCFVKPEAAVIPGIIDTISLGRGEFGVPNCDTMILAPLLPGRDDANVGHDQITHDPRARRSIMARLGVA